MKNRRLAVAAALATAAALLVVSAAAAGGNERRAGRDGDAVFVQTNGLAGNQVVVYDRADDGTLTPAGTYATGGNGGAALPGTESDRLASQGSLAYDPFHRILIAVNAGSDTVSAFRVRGDELELTTVLPSGGSFPNSVAVHDGLAYVLNAGGAGSVQGFRITGHGLVPIPGSTRSLGLANTTPPNFLTAPGQVGFTPDGRQLIVTTKASTSSYEVFAVGPDGRLSTAPVVTPSATPVPFAFTFGPGGRLVAGEAGASSVTTYEIAPSGTLSDPKSKSDGQVALCWIQRVGPFYFVSNTGSNTVSSFQVGPDGQPSLLAAVAATTDAGPIDQTASGGFLYTEAGLAGAVDEFRVNGDGSLTRIGSVTGLPAGIEGITAN
jgi:6-phosphogluconolactonase (cycloisomerase 2 family)